MIGGRARAFALPAIVLVAAIARVITCFFDGPLHPDEYFQYLEPAAWHLTGAGLQSWEWFEGLRCWVMPAYHGAWLYLFRSLGVPDGPPGVWLLKVHWALINSAIVVVAYRGGAFVGRRLAKHGALSEHAGGLVAAVLVAEFPLLVIYSGHTLSELPSMLLLLTGLVLSAELSESSESTGASLRRRALLIGGALSLGACIRIANAPMVMLPSLWLLAVKPRAFPWLLAGAALPAAVFALVDWITWGSLASSFVAYIKFNFLEDRAAQVFGTEPGRYYLEIIWKRLPWTFAPLAAVALFGARATWPFVGSGIVAVTHLSLQSHKEERFIVLVWPLLLIAAGGVVGSVIQRTYERFQRSDARRARAWRLGRALAVALVAGVVLADGVYHSGGRTWRVQARIDAQAWVGRQPEFSGLLMDYPLDGAGSLWLGRSLPHLTYAPQLLRNPVISHVLVASGSPSEREAREAGFDLVHREASIVVLARRRAQPQP